MRGPDDVERPALHHVQLKTTRRDALIEWYAKVCGMEVNFVSSDISFLTNDAANHRLAICSVSGLSDDPQKVRHTGMHHTAFEFRSLGGLLSRYEWLRDEADIVPHTCLDHGLTMSFYYLDPDRNLVEMQADNFGNWDLSSEWMRSSVEFLEDPIGRVVDPDLLVEALKCGVSPAEIHRRAWDGEYATDATPDLLLP